MIINSLFMPSLYFNGCYLILLFKLFYVLQDGQLETYLE
jgi:hypothetical protein